MVCKVRYTHWLMLESTNETLRAERTHWLTPKSANECRLTGNWSAPQPKWPVRPQPFAKKNPVARPGTDIRRPLQRVVRPGTEPVTRPVQRAVRSGTDITRPVQRVGRPGTEQITRPLQRAVRPGTDITRPLQRAVRPGTGQITRPVQRATRPGTEHTTRPVQRLRPEQGRPVKREVRPQPGARPIKRALRPEVNTKAVIRESGPERESPVKITPERDPATSVSVPVRPHTVDKSVQKHVKQDLEIKPAQVIAAKTDTSPKTNAKVIETSNKQPEIENITTGDYILNKVMTKMLNAELQDAMKKVLLDLNNAPEEDVESGVAGRVHRHAIPDLRNVLGLNVTKRLLNIYNPLNVKVKFNGKPEKEALREFLKKYNFIGFVRETVNIFAAQVREIEDFDRLCKEKEVKCGNVNVTVNPVYSFTTCPPNLVTNYIDISPYDIHTELGKDNGNELETNTSPGSKEKTDSKTTPDKTKITLEANGSDETKKNNPTDIKQDDNKMTGTKKKSVTPIKSQENVTTPKKQTTAATPTKVTPANKQIKTPTNTTQNPAKITPGKTTTTTKVESAGVQKTATQIAPGVKSTQDKPSVQQKPNQNKLPVKQTPGGQRKPTHNVKRKATQNNPGVQLKVTKTVNPSIKSTEDEDDYDELDDHDILALVSEGIVLDEYIGSDGE